MSFGSSTRRCRSTRVAGTICWRSRPTPHRSCGTSTWPPCTAAAAPPGHRLDTALCHPVGRRRRPAGRLPALPQESLARRIRVRLVLGRRLSAPRLALLPQGRGGRALHARCRAAACWPATRGPQSPCWKPCWRCAGETRPVLAAPAVRQRDGHRGLPASRPDAAPYRAIPLAEPNTRNPMPDFDDFLAALNQDKRKKIRQERRKVANAGVTLRHARGHDISPGTGTSSIAAMSGPISSTATRPI